MCWSAFLCTRMEYLQRRLGAFKYSAAEREREKGRGRKTEVTKSRGKWLQVELRYGMVHKKASLFFSQSIKFPLIVVTTSDPNSDGNGE